MGALTPKQYLPLNGKPIALHSLDLFIKIPEISEIIIVCEPEHQSIFPPSAIFAKPGQRRQDSVYSGLLKSSQEFIFIHDSARPFPEAHSIPLLLEAVRSTGAAALATPVTNTIKRCSPQGIVEQTLDRSQLWEMQTPQAIRRDLCFEAFRHIQTHNLQVTDDLSMIEALGLPAQIIPSSPRNFKITTPFDLALAETLIQKGLSCATN